MKLRPIAAAALVLLCGCSAANALAPQSGLGAPEIRRNATKPSAPLLYVSDAGTDKVYYYSYPDGTLEGTLSGFGAVRGLCSDEMGDVYVVDSKRSQIIKYAHGGTSPLKTLYDPEYLPNGCAVDSVTGRLAVTNDAISSGPGVLALYWRARGKPVFYGLVNIYSPSFCGFDNRGNLFVDGTSEKGAFELTEFPYHLHNLYNVTVGQSISVPGAVQWSGTHLAIGDQGVDYTGSTIYRFTVSHYGATETGSTVLGGSTDVTQFWITGERVIGPNHGPSSNDVSVWKYPAGGEPLRKLTGFSQPFGATLSE